MKATVILRDASDDFIEQVKTALAAEDGARQTYTWLASKANRYAFKDVITCQSGNGTFRDRVDWNSVVKSSRLMTGRLESRKGYKIVIFEG